MTDIDPMETSDELSTTGSASDGLDFEDTYDDSFETDSVTTSVDDTVTYTDPADTMGSTTSESPTAFDETFEDPTFGTGADLPPDLPPPPPATLPPTDASVAQVPTESPEIELVDPVGATATTGFDAALNDITSPATDQYATTDAPDAFSADLGTDSTDDVMTTEDAVEWRSAYDQWQAVVTTTGHAPTIGGFDDDGLPVDGTVFDPTPDDDGIAGEPFEDTGFWFEQNTAFTCGPASATQIVSDFTGNVQLNENDLAAYATQQGWMVDSDQDGDIDGMSINNLSQLLADHDVPNHVLSGSVEDLSTYLDEGRSIVLFVDNENLPGMHETQGAENSFTDTPNHFVRLTGIDEARGIAYLSDPGRPDGQNLVVPIDMLKEAWNDSNNYMVLTDTADPTPDGQTVTTGTDTGTDTTGTDTTGTDTTGTDTTGTDTTGTDTGPISVTPPAPPATPPVPAAPPAPAPAPAPAAPAHAAQAPVRAVAPVPPSAAPDIDPPPVDFGISDSINDMLTKASNAAGPAVDLTTPASQPDGLFDSALGFVLLPVAVSAGVAATLGYRKLRST